MRKVLITGKDSIIGSSLENCLKKEPSSFSVETLDMKDNLWKEKNFSEFDVVFHVAGIVHTKERKTKRNIYFIVNRDLAYKTAKKAKAEGVKQFIFMSTMSVYGNKNHLINKDTKLNPKSYYGKSKLEAEELIGNLADDSFTVAILRPPMVYGIGCKGNYPKLAKIALRIPFFPNVDNRRSMIFLDNLTEFIKLLINSNDSGLFFPQNKDYVNTSKMVQLIAQAHGKEVRLVNLFNPLINLLKIGIVNKIFGNMVYEMEMSVIGQDYCVCSFEESIYRTEQMI